MGWVYFLGGLWLFISVSFIIALFILFLIVVSTMAKKRGRSRIGWVLLSFIVSPLLVVLALACLGETEEYRINRIIEEEKLRASIRRGEYYEGTIAKVDSEGWMKKLNTNPVEIVIAVIVLIALIYFFGFFHSGNNTQNNTKQDNTTYDTQKVLRDMIETYKDKDSNIDDLSETHNNTKPVSILDKLGLEEVECDTEYDVISSVGAPHVMMKFKYISNEPVNVGINVEGVFINNKTKDVECKSSNFMDKTSLQSGMINEVNLSYQGHWWCNDDISCQIYLNGELYKTVKTPPQPCQGYQP